MDQEETEILHDSLIQSIASDGVDFMSMAGSYPLGPFARQTSCLGTRRQHARHGG
jgi:hypothetical protein